MFYPIIFDELYKEINEFIIPNIIPHRYMISSYGKIYDMHENKFINISMHSQGYYNVNLMTKNGSKQFLLHRLVAMAFVQGDRTLVVNHKDGIKTNPNSINLEWVTQSQNNIHAFENDLAPRGEKSVVSIITEVQVRKICELLDMYKYRYQEIADMVNLVSPDIAAFIKCIYKGESWRHISKDYTFAKNNYQEAKSGKYRAYNRY